MNLSWTRCSLALAGTALVVGLWTGTSAAQSPTPDSASPTASPTPAPERVTLELTGPASAHPGDSLTYTARYTATGSTELAFSASSRGLIVVSSKVVSGGATLLTSEPRAGEPVRWSTPPGSGELSVTYRLAEPSGGEGFAVTVSVFDSSLGHPRVDATTQLVPGPPATGNAGTQPDQPTRFYRSLMVVAALGTAGAVTALAVAALVRRRSSGGS